MICSGCAAEVPDDDVFCENCGARLGAPARPPSGAEACLCGAEVDEDGFCTQCGKRVRRPPSDHIEQALSDDFAAVSDRGLRHERNEDRFALVQEAGGYALVVCDGVSSTRHPEVASALAAEVLSASLREALHGGVPGDPKDILRRAFADAFAAMREHAASDAGENVPSTTALAALVRGDEITLGWAGDSRAYWIDTQGAAAWTCDHSWLTEALASGEYTLAEARDAPQAHAITRWLGADADPASEPEIAYYRAQAGGLLLLCTDGLWNYTPEPELLAELAAGHEGETALAMARRLVAFANEQGGRDNVTVAVLRFGQVGKSPGEPTSIC